MQIKAIYISIIKEEVFLKLNGTNKFLLGKYLIVDGPN